jgi:hypothetical protein
MKKRTGSSTGRILSRAMLIMVCGVFAATGAYAQGGAACLVNKIRVKALPAVTNAGTSLDVQVHFTNGTIQTQPGVNQGAPWPTTVVAVINLQPPMPLNTIKRIRLIYNGNLRAPVWDMTSMHARALGNTASAVIANAGAHQFTLAKPAFGVDTTIPGSACFISASPIAGPVRVAPGTPVQRTGPLMNAGVQQTMLSAQARPLLADGSKQSEGALNGASRTAITNSTLAGGIQPAAVPQVGASQPMSATGNAANPRVLAPPQTVAPTGSPLNTNSALTLSAGSNQSNSHTVAPPQTSAPAGLPLNTNGALTLNAGVSGSSTVTTNSALTLSGGTSGNSTVVTNSSLSLNGGTTGNTTVATNSSLSLNGATNQGGSRTVAPNSLAASGPLNTGSGGGSAPGTNSSLQPLIPRGGSNASSGGTGLMSLKPLIPRGSSSGGSNTGSASGVEKPLTNADVLNLLSARTSEQAILDRIRNHPATFDVSNQARANFDRACAGIKHPGVPTSAWATEIKHVWDTMVNVVICQQTNGRGGQGACDLTLLQSSPKKTSVGPAPIQPKVPGRSKYDAITLESGATQDTRFANWAQSGQAPNSGSPSTVQARPAMNAVGEVYGQSGNAAGGNSNACDVTQIRLRIGTGGDDLRGGQDNLNVLIYLRDAKPRVALNVNSSANWPNNSTHMVIIPINPPVPPHKIRAIRLFHIADGGFNAQSLENGIMATPAAPFEIAKAFQSPDNWDMSGLVASALGNGVGLRIATYGFHRFTGSNPDLVIYIPRKVMASACGTGRPAANGGSGSGGGIGSSLNPALNPGGSGLRPITGGGSGAGALGAVQSSALTNDGVVRMVKARVPESGIIAFIRVNPAKFDLSPNALIALRQAGVSPRVQQEMIRHGSGPVSVAGAQPSGIGGAAKADDLSPQPYPPKAMLPASGSQKTMLDTTSTVPAQVAVQRTASPAGVGPSQTMNSPGNSPMSGALTQQAGATAVAPASAAMVRAPFASANNAVIVASACANDPTFRVLGVSGATSGGSGGVTLTVEQQYTILGCSFGNPPLVKRTTPVSSPQSLAFQPNHYNVSIWMTPPNMSLLDVDASIQSWSDNAIVVIFHHSATFDGGSISLPDKVFPAQLLVTRADGQTVIYGYEGGLFFKLPN